MLTVAALVAGEAAGYGKDNAQDSSSTLEVSIVQFQNQARRYILDVDNPKGLDSSTLNQVLSADLAQLREIGFAIDHGMHCTKSPYTAEDLSSRGLQGFDLFLFAILVRDSKDILFLFEQPEEDHATLLANP